MKQTNPFYKTAAWLKCRETILIRDHYNCQRCLRKEKLVHANIVHHIKSLEQYPELALHEDNLETICSTCHNKEHPEKGGGKKEPERVRKAAVVKSKANRERW